MRPRRFFSHRALGLRANPFGALTPEEWTAVAFLPVSVPQILAHDFGHLQLLGPKGCGKTTTLYKLTEHFRQQGGRVVYEYLVEGQTCFETDLSRVDVFVLDEAQRLTWRQRRRWLQKATAVTFIFSSHKNLSTHFARRNLPLQTVQIGAVISLATYQAWLNKRLAYFALPNVPHLRMTDDAADYLWQRFGKDMREAEYFMYEVFQQEWAQMEIKAADLERFARG